MKLILISLLFLSHFAFAELEPADGAITQSTPVVELNDKNKDIKGTLAEPTAEQKKHVHNAAKKAKKKHKEKAKAKGKIKQKASKKHSSK
ncbi:hypothetical protein K2P97_04585 [bacterium]|nr:hypothetical protein [bacterium]